MSLRMIFQWIIVSIVFHLLRCSMLDLSTSIKDQIRRTLLNKDIYKKQERPDELNSTEVMVYMKIIAIDSVDVREMQYSIDVYLRQEWLDKRLAWNNLEKFKNVTSDIVSPFLKDNIWLPDLFFRNGKRGYIHNMTLPNFLMRLKPNGEVLYSQKITMVFSCQMELHAFPMDTQMCEINIGSYGYTLEELKFYWRNYKTIVVNQELKIPEFNTPTNIQTIDCTANSATSTGNYSCLKAILFFERQLGSYLASTYIPSLLIILVSWMNFWVSIEAVPARITLGLLSLLGILNQATSMSSTLPKVSYIKAIDVWLIACIIFVIAALLEFAIATTVSRRIRSRKWRSTVYNVVREEINLMHTKFNSVKENQNAEKSTATYSCSSPTNRLLSINNRVGVMEMTTKAKVLELLPPGMEMLFSNDPAQNEMLLKSLDVFKKSSKYAIAATLKSAVNPQQNSKKKQSSNESLVDNYSRFIFPFCYILFNCCYWFYYAMIAQYPSMAH